MFLAKKKEEKKCKQPKNWNTGKNIDKPKKILRELFAAALLSNRELYINNLYKVHQGSFRFLTDLYQ